MATVDRWLLPDGIEEVLPPQAASIETTRRQMLDLFLHWGYEYVVTPHVEFLESLLIGTGQDLDLRTFKVTDPQSGRQMGFRADITPQVARLDAHSLRREGAVRLCYAGSVVHALPRALSTSRSPIQIGAEVYGDPSNAADIEVISLMLECLAKAKVPNVHIDLGHVGIYRGLAQAANLNKELEQRLFDALQRKASSEIRELTADLSSEYAHMFNSLSTLCGGKEILAQAKSVFAHAPASVRAALTDLLEIAQVLEQRFPTLPMYFDLGELRGYHYHTGVVFAAFVPGQGGSIAQGGRYDDIGAVFGRARPATGFSTDLKSLVSLGKISFDQYPASICAPAGNSNELWQAISALRAQGQRVVQALPTQAHEDAKAVGCDRVLVHKDGQWIVESLD